MRGIKQSALAAAVKVSSGYLSQLEQGDSESEDVAKIKRPGSEIAARLANELNVPVIWLLYGEGPEPTWDSPTGGAAA